VSQYAGPLAHGIVGTVEITCFAFVLGCIGGLSLMLARRSSFPPLRWLATGYIELVRGIPPLAWLFLIYYGLAEAGYVKLGVMPTAVVVFAAIASAYLAEVFRSAVGAVSRQQWEAAAAVGLSPLAAYARVILPQAALVAIPPAAAYAIGLLKDSAVASTIGVHDIAFYAFDESQKTLKGLPIFVLAGLMYIALSVPIAVLARYVDHKLSRRYQH
jgi:polar amino acid transport system permease protein